MKPVSDWLHFQQYPLVDIHHKRRLKTVHASGNWFLLNNYMSKPTSVPQIPCSIVDFDRADLVDLNDHYKRICILYYYNIIAELNMYKLPIVCYSRVCCCLFSFRFCFLTSDVLGIPKDKFSSI